MPADKVEPALSLQYELQSALLTQPFTELLFGQSCEVEGRAVRWCVLHILIRTPVGTAAHLVDGIVGSSRRTIQLILCLSLDEQHLGITNDGGVR